MLPELLGFGPINISTFGIFAVIGFVVFSFSLWRNLREDYPEEEIITFTILITLFALLGARVVYLLDPLHGFGLNISQWLLLARYPGLTLVGGFFGALLFSIFWCRKKKWDCWVVADHAIFAFIYAFLIGGAGLLLIADELSFLLPRVALGFAVLLMAYFVRRRYRKFVWYKSGKPGFTSCLSVAFYFSASLILDFSQASGLYLGRASALAAVVLAIIFLYRRSGRNFMKDLAVFRTRKK